MTSQTNKPGVTGRQLIPTILGVLFVIFVVSLALASAKEAGNFGLFLIRLVVSALAALVVIYVQGYVWFTHVLDTPFRWSVLVEKFKIQSNNSYTITLLGIFANGVAVALAGSGKGVDAYLLAIGLRGTIGLAVGILITILIAWKAGVRSLDDYAGWIGELHNDNHAMLVSGVNTLTLVLALFA